MKNLFTLIALLTTLSISSQTISITKEQKQRINKIFTPEKIIDISKGLSNEKRQDSILVIKDNQIKELQAKIEALREEHKKTLISIAKQNKIAKNASSEEDKVSDDILKKEENKSKGFHLFVGAEIPNFNFGNSGFNSELMYQFSDFDIGVKGEISPRVFNTNTDYNFKYFLKVRYKIF